MKEVPASSRRAAEGSGTRSVTAREVSDTGRTPAGSSASVGVQTDEAAPAGGGGLSADALGALKEEMKAFIESKFDELARKAGGAAAAPGVGAPAAQVDVTFLPQTGIYMGVQQPTVSPRDRGSRLGPRSAVQSAELSPPRPSPDRGAHACLYDDAP